MAIEQKYLNVSNRPEAYLDIMMFVPDPSVTINTISCEDVLRYSNLNSLKDIKNYTTATIATLEENLWLLNGTFICPTEGRTYPGFISDSMSDDSGEFETNPTIEIGLGSVSKVEYFSVVLNPSVKSGYPKQMKVSLLDSEDNLLSEITKNIEEETRLPNLLYEFNTNGVSKLRLEYIGTTYGHRRARISSLMFGKLLTLSQNDIISSRYEDKTSFVADSIPTRIFSFDVENYSKKYNIDNPNNEFTQLDRMTRVMFRNGYNVYGYDETEHKFVNPYKLKEIAWDDEWTELRLIDISTSGEDTATFESGSILDVMTDTYTDEIFNYNRTVGEIVTQILNFEGLDSSVVTYGTNERGISYEDCIINTVLPEATAREIIQLLAFSVGATLLIKPDNTIKFANYDISASARTQGLPSFTKQYHFDYEHFTSVPAAEQLENTSKISLPKYTSSYGDSMENIQTVSIISVSQDISYSDCQSPQIRVSSEDESGGSILTAEMYTHRGYITANLPNDKPLTAEIWGYRIDTTESHDKSTTSDTLIVSTELMKEDPGNYIKNKYIDWYSRKFKYSMKTKGEPLVKAGDIVYIQTPFSNDSPCYVLRNVIDFDRSLVWRNGGGIS